MKPGDVVIGVLKGAVETKVRPGVVIASSSYLAQRPDVLIGILTSKTPKPVTDTDFFLKDFREAGQKTPSWFRSYILTVHRSELNVIGQLTGRDWESVGARLKVALGL